LLIQRIHHVIKQKIYTAKNEDMCAQMKVIDPTSLLYVPHTVMKPLIITVLKTARSKYLIIFHLPHSPYLCFLYYDSWFYGKLNIVRIHTQLLHHSVCSVSGKSNVVITQLQ
jgi:hypothetical protein